jgi:DNA polymerase-3 subunit chi
LQYACRLLRKASRKGVRVAVTGSSSTLTDLDRQLWSFEAEEFVPHVLVRSAPSALTREQRCPVWLIEDVSVGVELPVLVNLGEQVAPGFERYGRLIDVVGDDEASLDAGRLRWKHYLALGFKPRKHEVGA